MESRTIRARANFWWSGWAPAWTPARGLNICQIAHTVTYMDVSTSSCSSWCKLSFKAKMVPIGWRGCDWPVSEWRIFGHFPSWPPLKSIWTNGKKWASDLFRGARSEYQYLFWHPGVFSGSQDECKDDFNHISEKKWPILDNRTNYNCQSKDLKRPQHVFCIWYPCCHQFCKLWLWQTWSCLPSSQQLCAWFHHEWEWFQSIGFVELRVVHSRPNWVPDFFVTSNCWQWQIDFQWMFSLFVEDSIFPGFDIAPAIKLAR